MPELAKASSLPPVDAEGLLHLYREMVIIRRVEELAAKAYTMRRILGFCHLYIGQESVAVGTAAATKDDYWIAAYREHGHAVAKGMSPRAMMAELFGKATGCSSGLGGSMHLFDRENRFMGGWGIVGGHVPLANGVGWAIKRRNEDRVCVCFFGDGAAQQGAFFEALCLAQLFKLPVVFICENNYYAMGTSLERQSYLTDMSRRGDGVGMRRWQFQGFDVVDVYRNIVKAVEHARTRKGPVLVEARTYRYKGHSMSDPAKYRSKDEMSQQQERDPIAQMYRDLLALGAATEDDLAAMDKELKAQAKAALEKAKAAEYPSDDTLYDNLFAEPI